MTATKILRGAAVFLLCAVIFLTFGTGIAGTVLRLTAGESLAGRIADGEYGDVMHESVYAALEREMALVVIEPEDISDILTKDVIANQATAAVEAFVFNMNGGISEPPAFESEELYGRIEALLSGYAAETGILYEDGSAEAVYGMICDTVTAEIGVIGTELAETALRLCRRLVGVLSYSWVLTVIGAVCGAVLILWRRRRGAYYAVLSAYLGAFLWFAAAAVMLCGDYLGETVLGGALPYLAGKVYGIVFGDLFWVMLSVSIVMLIAAPGARGGKARHCFNRNVK